MMARTLIFILIASIAGDNELKIDTELFICQGHECLNSFLFSYMFIFLFLHVLYLQYQCLNKDLVTTKCD